MRPDPVVPEKRFDLDAHAPAFVRAMSHLDNASRRELDAAGIDPGLRELVRLRVSQVNGCAYCVDLHSRDARAAGVSEQRIWAVAAWRESPFFTARERAALDAADAVARLGSHDPDEVLDRLRGEFSEVEAAALLCLVVTINAWNALAVGSRTWAPAIDPGEPAPA